MTAVAFSPDGRVLATGDADRTVALWRAEDPYRPTELSALPGLADAVRAVAISPDSRLLAEGGEDGAIVLWGIGDARRPRLLARLPGDAGPVVGPRVRTRRADTDDGHLRRDTAVAADGSSIAARTRRVGRTLLRDRDGGEPGRADARHRHADHKRPALGRGGALCGNCSPRQATRTP
ncbi:WD40 repeat domain-containing protein [Streptomyces sp. L7]